MKLILMIIFTEAIVNLIFYAGPLQGIRRFLIRFTPLFTFENEHLLECKYCTSVWVGLFSAFIFLYLIDYQMIFFFILTIVIHRLSNYAHIIYSLIRDLQFNIRLNRGK